MPRVCDECGETFIEGYCADGEYYCDDACLHKHISPEEWEELCDPDSVGNDYYWSCWEEEE